jgi:hypothetical protein
MSFLTYKCQLHCLPLDLYSDVKIPARKKNTKKERVYSSELNKPG